MTSRDIVLTWSSIYKGLIAEFPLNTYAWNIDDLHQIVTELTVAAIKDPKS